ncbi:hypothetical protein BT96DRAFT_783002, partial [Gymnopus androsaceus JB14]
LLMTLIFALVFPAVFCLGIAFVAGLFRIHLSPLSISIPAFKLDRRSRYLSVGETHVIFHIPCRKQPQWASLSINNVEYRSVDSQHFTISKVSVILRFFPVLLSENNILSQPALISVTLDNFCLRIASSQRTPLWLVALRRNLLNTILNEETRRLDNFGLKVLFSMLNARGKDESRITHISTQWHLHNHVSSQLYQFGQLTAQLRRTREDDTGTFSLIAEDCHWIR